MRYYWMDDADVSSHYLYYSQTSARVCLRKSLFFFCVQIERLHESGERAGLATAVMEHATAMVNLASAFYVCQKIEEAKVRQRRLHEAMPMQGYHVAMSKCKVAM